jgi:hypothetical protein
VARTLRARSSSSRVSGSGKMMTGRLLDLTSVVYVLLDRGSGCLSDRVATCTTRCLFDGVEA